MAKNYKTRVNKTLDMHLRSLDQNAPVSEGERVRLTRTVVPHLKSIGYKGVPENLRREYVDLICKLQNDHCVFWLEVELGETNGIWNDPQDWDKTEPTYHWDHSTSKCSTLNSSNLENLSLLSPNGNRFIKNSNSYEDLLRRVDFSDRFKERIKQVMKQRRTYFASAEWAQIKEKFAAFKI